MGKIIISSDSTCDLSENIISENDIKILPISILIGDTEYHDRVDITATDVIKYVKEKGIMPKTSAGTIDNYKEWFKSLIKDKNDEVIHFCISSGSSSCVNNAYLAAKEFKNVHVIDSLSLSSGQGIQIVRACDLIRQGKSCKEIVEEIENARSKVQISFVIDTMEFLHKGGRCSAIVMYATKMLKLHPSIAMKDGKLQVKKKYMGNLQRALSQYILDLSDEYKDYDKTRCFITYSPTEKEIVEEFKKKVQECFNFDEIIESDAGSTVTAHCGYNTIGLIFYEK